jgi:hypothetical protein
MIDIEIKSAQYITRQGQKGPYYQQPGYAFLIDRDGVTEPYPTKIMIFCGKDERDNPISYKPGIYTLSPSSLRVGKYDKLEVGFINLVSKTPAKL